MCHARVTLYIYRSKKILTLLPGSLPLPVVLFFPSHSVAATRHSEHPLAPLHLLVLGGCVSGRLSGRLDPVQSRRGNPGCRALETAAGQSERRLDVVEHWRLTAYIGEGEFIKRTPLEPRRCQAGREDGALEYLAVLVKEFFQPNDLGLKKTRFYFQNGRLK